MSKKRYTAILITHALASNDKQIEIDDEKSCVIAHALASNDKSTKNKSEGAPQDNPLVRKKQFTAVFKSHALASNSKSTKIITEGTKKYNKTNTSQR